MLNHLRLAGQLDHVRGIVFGDPSANIHPNGLETPSSKPPASTPSNPSPAPSASASNPAT